MVTPAAELRKPQDLQFLISKVLWARRCGAGTRHRLVRAYFAAAFSAFGFSLKKWLSRAVNGQPDNARHGNQPILIGASRVSSEIRCTRTDCARSRGTVGYAG